MGDGSVDDSIRALRGRALPGLADLRSPPAKLWVRGAAVARPAVAIVGTRRADRSAIAFARRLARELAEAGVGIVSGGAYGVDIAAHRGALDAGGQSWVVQAAPLERPYPSVHRPEFEAMLAFGGGWISETPPGQGAARSRFIARNRIIAALATRVVVVQAPARSGALSTARAAIRIGRPLFATPSAPWDARSAGSLALLRSGAATICASAADVLDGWIDFAPAVKSPRPKRESVALSDDAKKVAATLEREPAHPDDIVARAQLSAARTSVALIELAEASLAVSEAGGWRRRDD